MIPAIDQATAELDRFARRVSASRPDVFRAGAPIVAARAPGRLDVMGGISDYSGGLVLELTASVASLVAVQPADGGVTVTSVMPGDNGAEHRLALAPSEWRRLLEGSYATAREELHARTEEAWAGYVIGVLLALAKETGADLSHGVQVLVESKVPIGKGLSSSAAIEVATARAVVELLGQAIPGEELARLCQLAENRVVGAPCGIMDQMTSALGHADRLLALLCQPATIEGHVRLPDALGVWGIDSGIQHAVSGADYGSVRTGAFMGYRILADLTGLRVTAADEPGKVAIDDKQWGGYLANVDLAEFRAEYADHLPAEMAGREFLDRYGGISDPVTAVDPGRAYAVRQPTAHPVGENVRVRRFRELLQGAVDEVVMKELGRLMFASHESYSACGLGSEGTDALVRMCAARGPASGVFGAKITGGGSGGTVAVLGRADAGPMIDEIAAEYRAVTGHSGTIYSGSSAGACYVPCVHLG